MAKQGIPAMNTAAQVLMTCTMDPTWGKQLVYMMCVIYADTAQTGNAKISQKAVDTMKSELQKVGDQKNYYHSALRSATLSGPDEVTLQFRPIQKENEAYHDGTIAVSKSQLFTTIDSLKKRESRK